MEFPFPGALTRALSLAVPSAALLLWCVSAQDGGAIYKRSCAPCHEAGVDRAPTHEALHAMSPERVLAAMESGPMISMANRQSAAARRAIAEFITGKSFAHPMDTAPPAVAMCSAPAPEFGDPSSGPLWNGWGQNLLNTRFQSGAQAGLSATDLSRLKVKWAFGFPATLDANAHPPSRTDAYSSEAPAVTSIRWTRRRAAFAGTSKPTAACARPSASGASKPIPGRTTPHSSVAALFAYAVAADTGRLIWKTQVDTFPAAHITGSPIFYNNRLYVPVASGEEGSGASPDYECCRFRGSMVALDASTGKQIWKTYTIAEEPHKTKKNKIGTQLWGPSGAPIWSSPSIDVQRNALYATTGDNYSDPTSRMSDAFMAFDLDTGKILWSRQMTASDAYTAGCRIPDKTNCPDSNGPDFDFSSGPILVTLANGKRALVAGQKSGLVHAVDPDNQGELIWSVRVGQGGTNGGVQWGSATDGKNVYVALADLGRVVVPYSLSTDVDPKRGGGMFALSLDTGKQRLVHSAGALRRSQALQSRAIGGGHRDSRRRVLRLRGRASARLTPLPTAPILWDIDTVRTLHRPSTAWRRAAARWTAPAR